MVLPIVLPKLVLKYNPGLNHHPTIAFGVARTSGTCHRARHCAKVSYTNVLEVYSLLTEWDCAIKLGRA